jgi:HlyD family secretion protein
MSPEKNHLDQGLNNLRIDRNQRRPRNNGSKWSQRWIITGVVILILLGVAATFFKMVNKATEVEIYRVTAQTEKGASGGSVILNAAGYIVPHHKIELTSKVIGRVAWIGVEKGDKVKAGQTLVRLEDEEYRAQVDQSKGSLASLVAQLQQLENGSRPEEIRRAEADLLQAKSDLENARVNYERVKKLNAEGVLPKQDFDNAESRFQGQEARVASLTRTLELYRLGPRREEIEAMKGRVAQARGDLALRQTYLDATVIKAPVNGTILERAVEVGEFVTTSFVGDRGAKGYVVSMADLNDLQVELDISQDDFAKLRMGQKAVVTTDAFPDRKYEGEIAEMSPEANRQKATVQVKVQILKPDAWLRPEMNAKAAFLAKEDPEPAGKSAALATIMVPTTAVCERDGKKSVFVVFEGKAVEKAVQVRNSTSNGVEIGEGLLGGEEIVLNPPTSLKNGDKVAPKQKQG